MDNLFDPKIKDGKDEDTTRPGEIIKPPVKGEEVEDAKPAAKPKRGRPKKESQETPDGRVLLFMQSGSGWQTAEGVGFSFDHPYQLVSAGEAEYLLNESRFRKATVDEVKEYYSA